MPKNKTPASRNSPARQPNPQPQVQPRHNQIMRAQQWSGPLPPPAALEHFNHIIPDGAERIIKMVEQEQAHRIQFETTGINATIKDTRRGHWIGGLISLIAIGGSIFTAYIGAHPTVSVALVSVPIATIVIAFIKSRN